MNMSFGRRLPFLWVLVFFLFAGVRAQEPAYWESSYSSARVLQISGRIVSWTSMLAFGVLAMQDKEEEYKWLIPVAMAGVPMNGIGTTGMARALNEGKASPKAEVQGWEYLAAGSGALVLGTAGFGFMDELGLDKSEKVALVAFSATALMAGIGLYGYSWYLFSYSASRIADQRSSLVLSWAPLVGCSHGTLLPGMAVGMRF